MVSTGAAGGRQAPQPRADVSSAAPRPATRGLRAGGLILGTALMIGLGAPPTTAALLTDSRALPGLFATDTLNPPTVLTASGGTSVTLSWTPTVDPYAAGYLVFRSTASSGPFVQIGTRTPWLATAYTDTPTSAGTYWYVLQSYLVSWTSASTSAVSAAFNPGVTGFKRCTAQVADTGGDNNGYEGTAANGCAVDGAVATDTNSGSGTSTSCTSTAKDRHRFSAFGLGVPSTASVINGISVRVKLGLDLLSGTNLVCAQISGDGGTTWTATQSAAITAAGLTTYTLGGAANLWGRTWTTAQLSDANFRVRLINVSSNNARDFRLDGVEVQVSYTP
ncbi:MAG: hypothetical protein C0498_12605 [Anaerolinea sp.]|nr:hypothetical protein [Anaerolinea sp.]